MPHHFAIGNGIEAAMDASRCPLCHQANQCAMETGKALGLPPTTCWCVNATIDAALLAQIPFAARNLACICPTCASQSSSLQATLSTPATNPKETHANIPY